MIPAVLDEEQVRDQVAAAEELAHLGHDYPAAVAAGAAIEASLRLRSGSSASAEEMLDHLWHQGAVADLEHERLRRTVAVGEQLTHGFVPRDSVAASPERVRAALEVAIRLLEDVPAAAAARDDARGQS